MTFKLDLADLPGSVAAVAHAQLRDAAEQLERVYATDPETAVHEARKDVKKFRALLRVLRSVVPPKVRRVENAAVRDASALISGARDADVMITTLDALRDPAAGRVPGTTFDAAIDFLRGRTAHVSGDGFGATLTALRAADQRIDAWARAKVRPSDLVKGMVRTYADGMAAMEKAREAPTNETLHEWRKRVKDLWYEERLIHDAWPAVLKARAAEDKVLSELLGDDHDLAVLSERLPELPVVVGELPHVIALRREALQAEAFGLGARIYAERPKDFGRRVDAWLRAAGKDAPEHAAA